MPIDLYGKYWLMSELKKKYDAQDPSIRSLLWKMDGVVKVGQTLLIPDEAIPVIEEAMKKTKDRVVSIKSYYAFGANSEVLERVIKSGFPAIERDGNFYIEQDNIPAIKKAAAEIREEYGKVSILKAQELARKALEYLAEGNQESKQPLPKGRSFIVS